MRDEALELFIGHFGEADRRIEVPRSSIEKYRGKLPDLLLSYWEEEGWASYGQGLLWTVDPDDYEDVLDEWLEDTPFEQIDAYHVFARSALGDLYVCGEQGGSNMTVACSLHGITAVAKELRPKSPKARDTSIEIFFAMHEPQDADLKDEDGHRLFARALKRLGALEADEMYGFEPAVAAGGALVLDNLRKVKLEPHLTILRQLAPPQIPFSGSDLEKLMR